MASLCKPSLRPASLLKEEEEEEEKRPVIRHSVFAVTAVGVGSVAQTGWVSVDVWDCVKIRLLALHSCDVR